MLRLVLPALLVAASLPAAAQTSPATDCSKIILPVDKAICTDPLLGDLDRAIAKAFAKVRARVDRDALKDLEKDQKNFMAERALVFENRAQPLAAYLQNRLAFLETIESPPWGRDTGAFVGQWRSTLGEVRVSRDSDGALVIAISTLSPAETRWICDIEGTATPKSGKLQFSEDDVTITLTRRGSALVIGDQVPQGDGGRPFCGGNGYIDGPYFKVRDSATTPR